MSTPEPGSHAADLAELRALAKENAALRAALQAAVDTIACLADGEEHVNPDCPEDDTCDCENIAAINAAMAQAAALGVVPRSP